MKQRQKIRKALLLLSFVFYPVTFFVISPDLLLFGASENVMAGDVLFFGGLLVFSLFGGRLFCGWLCPAGMLQDYISDIQKKPASNRWNWIKMALFIPWFLFFVLLAISAGGFKEFDFFYKRAFGIPIGGITEWTMYFMTVAIVMVLAFSAGRRGFCHVLCWVSPFMIAGRFISDYLRIPAVRLKTNPELCNACDACSLACSMSLPVVELVNQGEIRHSECILCGSCADVCPEKAIYFVLKSPR